MFKPFHYIVSSGFILASGLVFDMGVYRIKSFGSTPKTLAIGSAPRMLLVFNQYKTSCVDVPICLESQYLVLPILVNSDLIFSTFSSMADIIKPFF